MQSTIRLPKSIAYLQKDASLAVRCVPRHYGKVRTRAQMYLNEKIRQMEFRGVFGSFGCSWIVMDAVSN